jgi:hypothetical protein
MFACRLLIVRSATRHDHRLRPVASVRVEPDGGMEHVVPIRADLARGVLFYPWHGGRIVS